ncbi:MAG: type II toxin-antitoxin system PemK/MazF family toxin [Methylovulum sp.]|nr:type II toxin-antitoxin system PemK/MazF family toxin [Methylovulum sp.]
MGFKRGNVHLVNFNPSKGTEAGKIRPALILQANALNDADHPSTLVLPLTTQIHANAQPLRFNLAARDALNQASDVMLDQARAIDNQRITSEPLTSLSEGEMATIERYMKIILGFEQ